MKYVNGLENTSRGESTKAWEQPLANTKTHPVNGHPEKEISRPLIGDGQVAGQWWTLSTSNSTQLSEDSSSEEFREAKTLVNRIQCNLCPRHCQLKEGDRGFCFVRENVAGQMVLSTYGRSTGFCIDPIEKKPLNHFYPGTPVLSFGTAGCNLGCKFCQNWDISKSREVQRLSDRASPSGIAHSALQSGCTSVAYTYNDPIIWAEYAIDTAIECRKVGVKNVAVTAGYITAEAREDFFRYMDAANVDLKAFTEDFYYRITYSHLQPVLDTLVYLRRETDVWFELTNLVIPQANDSHDEFRQMCDWILTSLGDDVPIHFTAFHPDFRMKDRAATPIETLIEAQEIARKTGLKFAYIGNVHHPERQSTFCPNCNQLLIQRDWYQLGEYHLQGNRCRFCQTEIAGRWLEQPGTWGRRRERVTIREPDDVIQLKMPAVSHKTTQENATLSRPQIVARNADMATTLTPEALPSFSQDEEQRILKGAGQMVIAAVLHQPAQQIVELLGPVHERTIDGVFVTLKRGSFLRGCCGVLGSPMPLGRSLAHAVVNTARNDQRMPPISPVELPYLSLDLTILGPLEIIANKGIARREMIELGRHGLRITRGNQSGLLLPSVPVEQGWNLDEYLIGVCRKAGLPDDAWLQNDVQLARFDGHKISGKLDLATWQEMNPTVGSVTPEQWLVAPNRVPDAEVQKLAQLAANNLIALSRGATPTYPALDVHDGTVEGIIVSVTSPADSSNQQIMRLSMRPGLPLQTTLLEICQNLAKSVDRFGSKGALRVDLAILQDPAFHGMISDAHLEGVSLQERALLLSHGQRSILMHQPHRNIEETIEKGLDAARLRSRDTMIHSLAISSTLPEVIVCHTPQPVIIQTTRPAAVIGSFYPGEPATRIAMVKKLMGNSQPAKKRCFAAMVPHAGLKYSGEIAASVLKRIELPKSILIIGPKHTAIGVDWAISPHAHWQIGSDASIEADLELSHLLAERLSDMQLDAAAHQRDHSIEVELPLIHYIDPSLKVAGIVMHGGSWPEIKNAAQQLATTLNELPEPPLLLISSDMNHFATDAENRRLDQLALDVMQQGDPQKLLAVCRDCRISMCGVVPAALVMQTLIEMGRPLNIERVGYDTSASVTGDKSRVVGYAGMLFTS